MSDDSKQLSVAELLARNGQQGSASSGGGGRRRRSGRGISVAELTGDLPVIPANGGRSSHAAPDEPALDAPSYEQPAAYEPSAYQPSPREPAPYEPAAYQPSAFELPAPEPVSYAPPLPEPELPSYSPMSGPITRYDPLSDYAAPEPDPLPGRSSRVMPGRDMPVSRHAAPADPLSSHAAPDPYAPIDPYAPADPYGGDPLSGDSVPPLGSGRTGRRRRHDPDESATEVRPMREAGRADPLADRGPLDGPAGNNRARTGRAARRRAEEARAEEVLEVGPSTAPWSSAPNGFAPESAPLPLSPLPEAPPRGNRSPSPEPPPEPPRRSSRRAADGGLPAWSARRHHAPTPQNNDLAPESGAIPTAAWSLASQDQQLVSGQTVAGDLLRDEVERAEREGAERASRREGGRGKRGRGKRDAGRDLDIIDLDDVQGRTDVHPAFEVDPDPLEDEDDFDEHPDSERSGIMSPRRSRVGRKVEYDANRRQWMILGGQSTGAAVAGMLLFKGFERMWEMLPWVALALAMIVILGLVALVRILRRTDDILSTVIAVVVGIFVTLGPLAFLLSTN
ncbi:hypothetical protein [Nocardia sp. NPDC051463]|uniref:hypothetical protein n=1 Tax=Nocardia sp. NPDC051463 TaxID=3154845 RepID=UPI00341940D6